MSRRHFFEQAITTRIAALWLLAVLTCGAGQAQIAENPTLPPGQTSPVILLGVDAAPNPAEQAAGFGSTLPSLIAKERSDATSVQAAPLARPTSRFSALGTVCQPNYWIVSGRHCPQSCPPYAWHCRFDYLHVGPGGRIQRATQQDFVQSLCPGVPVCLVVHGSFVPFEYVAWQTYYTYQWLRAAAPELPLHIVFYTWPSEAPVTGIPQIDVELLGRRGEFNGFYLSRLISLISPDHPLALLGHSHGTRVIASALHLLGGGSVQGYCLPRQSESRRIRVVFAASAMDHDWLNPEQRYGRALSTVEGLVNLRNRMDIALFLYPLAVPFSRRTLGRAGFTESDLYQLGWLATKISECDVTPLIGFAHQWVNYLQYPMLARLIAPFVYFSDSYQEGLPDRRKAKELGNAPDDDGSDQRRAASSPLSMLRISKPTERLTRNGMQLSSGKARPADAPAVSCNVRGLILDASSTSRYCLTAHL